MPVMPCNHQMWSELHAAIELRSLSAGVRFIRGSSVQIANEIRTLLPQLDDTCIEYFLCSGDNQFQPPCYGTLLDVRTEPVEPLNAFHVMDYSGLSAREERDIYTQQYALSRLEQRIEKAKAALRFVILEYLTPPTRNDINFIKHLLLSPLIRQIPVLVTVHQPDDAPIPETSARELLLLLYMAGGRIRDREWNQLTIYSLSLPSLADTILASRRIGSSIWITYSNRTVADLAKKTFDTCTSEQKRHYAETLLQVLPSGTIYPLLSIASYVNEPSVTVSCYTSSALKASLMQPQVVLAYFRTLRRGLKRNGDPALLEVATANMICALLWRYTSSTIRLYRIIQANEAYFANRVVKAHIIFVLGQMLLQSRDQGFLPIATECFQHTQLLLSAEKAMSRPENTSRFAAIRNAQALIYLKQGQYETALQLEKVALTELQQIDIDSNEDLLAQQTLLLTHIGDIYGRKLGNKEAALSYYREASLHVQKTSSLTAQTYVLPRLSDMLLQTGHDVEALDVLESLWRLSGSARKTAIPINRTLRLKTGLTLAQMYMKKGLSRKAAAYYWILLREAAWLKPATVRGIVANLKHCRPTMNMRLWKCVLRITTLQEVAMRDVTNIERYFANILANETFSLNSLDDDFTDRYEEERA
ncbi:MAG: hypothetical protein JO215_09325 [Ktedonobacteraceae bacterium]|nr:hypothetical protein [Ktedonobacteraceae bacterium]